MLRKNIEFNIKPNLTDSSPYCSQCNSPLCNNAHQSFSKRKKRFSVRHLLIYASIALIVLPSANCLRHLDTSSSSSSLANIDTTTNNKSAPLKHDETPHQIIVESGELDDEDYSVQSSPEILQSYLKQNQNFGNHERSELKSRKSNAFKKITTVASSSQETCSSTKAGCTEREEVEMESIKKHLLAKLGMTKLPNATKYPKLNENDIINFCRKNAIPIENCLGRKSLEYQSDEEADSPPLNDDNYDDSYDLIDVDEDDVQFSSVEKRIYAFPITTPNKQRHKQMRLMFKFSESQKRNNLVAEATLNLYIFENALSSSAAAAVQLIDVEILIVTMAKSRDHKIYETFKNITVPKNKGKGDYIQLNVTSLVSEWFQNKDKSNGIQLRILDTKTQETLSHKIVALDANHFSTRPYIDINLRDQRKQRAKRSLLECTKGSNETRCCRHELIVDFDKFGWDWIIAPKKYDANYCSGECKIAFNQQYPHTHVMQMSTSANPCCSPRKMGKIMLLYFDTDFNIVLSTIPNMKVEECFCS